MEKYITDTITNKSILVYTSYIAYELNNDKIIKSYENCINQLLLCLHYDDDDDDNDRELMIMKKV